VQYPASDPAVLTCGGTTIGNIAKGTFEEYVWNDTFTINGEPASGATCGGVSDFFALPAYQQGAGVPTSVNNSKHTGRGLPDVAANASWNSGYYPIYCPIGTAAIGYPNPYPGNGTSVAAPLYAGLIAVINAALGEPVGFLNPTLYALGESVCRDIAGPPGPENNEYEGVKGYPAGKGWDACTGWGVVDGNALLTALRGVFRKELTIVLDRSTFGQNEVTATKGLFPAALFVTVDGLKPSEFPHGGITTLSASATQLEQWAPSIPAPKAPGGVTNIEFIPTAVSSDDPGLSAEVQRFTFTYEVKFPDGSAFGYPGTEPEILTIEAQLAATSGGLLASAEIELVKAADPYYSSESHGGLSYLSEDLRVFYAEEGSTKFGAPPLGNTPAAARSFIQWIIARLSGPEGTGPNGETFEALPTNEETSAISLFEKTLPLPFSKQKAVYNFAIARVRLDGTSGSEEAKQVRGFFRLFQAQSLTTPYQSPSAGAGSSPATGPYRQWSDGKAEGRKIPLLGLSPDGGEYVTVPFFASERVANTSSTTTMTSQEDPPNVKTIKPVSGETVYAYFGCWLDTNQAEELLPSQPPANPDGPFSGALSTIGAVLLRGGHQCLVTEIVDDEAPIIQGATPAGGSDKIAQRNVAFTIVANPGMSDSRLATHTFEARPSLTSLSSDERPDELMIDWRDVPHGSVASIYMPAVAAEEVLELAGRMYATHNLTITDPHTLQCATGGTTYVPIPQGGTENLAGLLSVELPAGIKHGQTFEVVVRQLTSALLGSQKREGLPQRRYVYGAFQLTIPVSTKTEMLVPAERLLSVMRWIDEHIEPASRWRPVFDRYLEQLAGRVAALGGDPANVPATREGIWPGLVHEPKPEPHPPGPRPHPHGSGDGLDGYTGKVRGIVYDAFGDFGGFILELRDGERHRFDSDNERVHELVRRAWEHEVTTTVVVREHDPWRPYEIVLHVPPAA
jgi:hypothetical protein